jgi:exonuclease-1
MGIPGLLPSLKSVTERVHLDAFRGQTVGVDAYSWLHKGVYTFALECHRTPRPTGGTTIDADDDEDERWLDKASGHIEYCVQRVRQLMHHGIRPFLVFDGAPLPSKAGKECERHASRLQCRQKAKEAMREGRVAQAASLMARGVDVTPAMAHRLIERLRALRVHYVVAPYEADAQLAWLALHGKVSAVIAEDSDLLVYGIPRVLFKLDKQGQGELVQLARLRESSSTPSTSSTALSLSASSLDLSRFSMQMWRHMCILAGCDYASSLPGVGIKTAHRYVLRYRTWERVVQVWRAEGRCTIPPDYEQQVRQAEWTFQHQVVYDLDSRRLCHLHPLPDCTDSMDWSFLGHLWDDEQAGLICREARLCPIERREFVRSLKEEAVEEESMTQQTDVDVHLVHGENIPQHRGLAISQSRTQLSSVPRYVMSRGVRLGGLFKPSRSPNSAMMGDRRQRTIRDYFLPKTT